MTDKSDIILLVIYCIVWHGLSVVAALSGASLLESNKRRATVLMVLAGVVFVGGALLGMVLFPEVTDPSYGVMPICPE